MNELEEYCHSQLHDLLTSGNWEEAKNRVDKNYFVQFKEFRTTQEKRKALKKFKNKLPTEVKFKNSFGLPLHLALKNSAPLDLIKALLHKNREAIHEKWVDESYPLHIACSIALNQGQIEVIKLLIRKCSTILLFDDNKSTPLHLLCEHEPPIKLIRMIFRREDKSNNIATSKDNEGRLPLHVALDYEANEDVILFLMNKFSRGARHKQSVNKDNEDANNLPIHIAVSRGCSKRVLCSLLKENPESVAVRGEYNDTPLHLMFNEYKFKYTQYEGQAIKEANCDAETMMRLMIQYYYSFCRKCGHSRAKTRKNIQSLLMKKDGHYDGMSVYDLLLKQNVEEKLPQSFISFVKNLIKGSHNWDEGLDLSHREVPQSPQDEEFKIEEDDHSEVYRTFEYLRRHGMANEEDINEKENEEEGEEEVEAEDEKEVEQDKKEVEQEVGAEDEQKEENESENASIPSVSFVRFADDDISVDIDLNIDEDLFSQAGEHTYSTRHKRKRSEMDHEQSDYMDDDGMVAV